MQGCFSFLCNNNINMNSINYISNDLKLFAIIINKLFKEILLDMSLRTDI